MDAAIYVLQYLSTIQDYYIFYSEGDSTNITRYIDSNWVKEYFNWRFTWGYMFLLKSTHIAWNSKNKPIVALFFIEAKYKSLLKGVKEAIWLQSLLKIINKFYVTTTIFVGTKAILRLLKIQFIMQRISISKLIITSSEKKLFQKKSM